MTCRTSRSTVYHYINIIIRIRTRGSSTAHGASFSVTTSTITSRVGIGIILIYYDIGNDNDNNNNNCCWYQNGTIGVVPTYIMIIMSCGIGTSYIGKSDVRRA